MSDDKPEAEIRIDSLDPDPVKAALRVNKQFKLIGSGFSKKDIEVYISDDKCGKHEISNINVHIEDHSTSIDGFLKVVAKPELGAPMNEVLWVAVRLNGSFQSAIKGFKVV